MSDTYKNIPFAINSFTPEPKPDAKEIVALVKQSGKITGYKLSNGEQISKADGVARAKQGDIMHVGIATRKGNEYLRTLPDGNEGNNLSNLPSVTQ